MIPNEHEAGAEPGHSGRVVDSDAAPSKTMTPPPTPPEIRALVDQLTTHLSDEGRLIEAGWVAFKAQCLHKHAQPEQVHDMHLAFFAGAQHLFASIMSILEPGAEPTDNDLKRMDLIHKELVLFVDQLKAKHPPSPNPAHE